MRIAFISGIPDPTAWREPYRRHSGGFGGGGGGVKSGEARASVGPPSLGGGRGGAFGSIVAASAIAAKTQPSARYAGRPSARSASLERSSSNTLATATAASSARR